jgi:S1-C subfamily serine protease
VAGATAFRVTDVLAGSPARQGGLEPNDFIVEIDDKQFYSVNDVLELLGEKLPGELTKVEFIRFDKGTCRSEYRTAMVKMGARQK